MCRALHLAVCGVLAAQGRVPVVLDGILCAPVDDLGNVCPAVAHALVLGDELGLLALAPGVPLDVGPQLVVPALATLLADAPREVLGDDGPVALAMLTYQPVQQVQAVS